MSLVRHVSWSAGAAVILTASRFAVTAILARRLTQEAFGQYAYSQWLVDIAFLLCSLGATGAVSRYAAEFRHDPALFKAFMRKWQPFALGLPFLAALAALLGSWLSGMHLDLTTLMLLSTWGLMSGLWAMQTAALAGMQRFDLIFIANAIAAFIMVVGGLVLPFEHGNPSLALGMMAFAALCGSLVGMSVTVNMSRRESDQIPPERVGRIRSYALNIWITALLWSLVWSRGEMPIVRTYLGDVGVAAYAAALTLVGGAIAGVMLGLAGISQQLTRLLGERKPEQAISLARRVMDAQLLLCTAAALVLIWFAPEVVLIAFGEGYKSAAPLLATLAILIPAMSVSLHNHLLQIVTDARYNRNTALLGLVILFTLALLLVPVLGALGAATARASTLLLLAMITIMVSRRRWGNASISFHNISLVIVSCAVSLLLSNQPAFASLGYRITCLAIILLLILFTYRGMSGLLIADFLRWTRGATKP